jgi:hypothetical protein
MANHRSFVQATAGVLTVLSLMAAAHAADFDRRAHPRGPLVLQDGSEADVERYGARPAPPRPYGRPVNGGPGYVGSDYGLGKPAFTGLGSRPDWGHSE